MLSYIVITLSLNLHEKHNNSKQQKKQTNKNSVLNKPYHSLLQKQKEQTLFCFIPGEKQTARKKKYTSLNGEQSSLIGSVWDTGLFNVLGPVV